jgi:type III secretion protein J
VSAAGRDRGPGRAASPAPAAPRRRLPIAAALLGLAACGRTELLHALDERQASQVLLALDEGGVPAETRRDADPEGGWLVEVAAGDAPRARRLLAERELPRAEPGGLAAAYGKGSVVPTPAEERARFLHAVAGELSRSVESIDGVVEARAHVALPPDDPLRGAPPPPPRAAVLVKVRPGARGRVEPLAAGIQALAAGAVPGLEPAQVAVVVVEAAPPGTAPGRSRPRPVLLALGAGACGIALLLLVAALGTRLPRPPLFAGRRRPAA